MIVVDLGCCPHDGDVSHEMLIDEYLPDVLYGFDPLLPLDQEFVHRGARVALERVAAWTFNGRVDLAVGAPQLLDATVLPEKNDRGEWSRTVSVPCFDFAAWLNQHGPAVVKMNIEGAEFPLLEHLHATGADSLISELIVAWHDDRLNGEFPAKREHLEANLRCPVEEWALPTLV